MDFQHIFFTTVDIRYIELRCCGHPWLLQHGGETETDVSWLWTARVFLLQQGASANWWNHRHFQHHAKPNIFKKDPDVNMLHLFVLGDTQPVEVRLRGYEIKLILFMH